MKIAVVKYQKLFRFGFSVLGGISFLLVHLRARFFDTQLIFVRNSFENIGSSLA